MNPNVGRIDLNIGSRVKIINDPTYMKKMVGEFSMTISRISENGGYQLKNGRTYHRDDLEFIPDEFKKADVVTERDKLLREMNMLQSKLQYLDEADSDIATDEEFRIYQTLCELDNKLTKTQKVKTIAQLFN